MWKCPKCERSFKSTNQSHSCSNKPLDDFFEGKPDNLLLAFDQLLVELMDWEGVSVGPASKAIIFSIEKAWLIVRPMSKVLDLKFYSDRKINHRLIHKVHFMMKKYAHHIRISTPEEVNEELLKLLHSNYVSQFKTNIDI